MGNNTKLIGVSIASCLSILFYFIPSVDLFRQFMPRSVCMFHDTHLIAIHGIADSFIALSYFFITVILFKVYHILETKKVPLKGFLWMFGIFIFFCGVTHAMGVLNLFVTFYWLDGAFKIICAIFSIVTAVAATSAPGVLDELYTQEEYHEQLRINREQEIKNQEQQQLIEQLTNRVTLLEKGTI